MASRRPHGSGSLLTKTRSDGRRVYYAKFRDQGGRQVKRKIGLVRSAHQPDGLTKAQAEARLRDVIQSVERAPAIEHARTVEAAAAAWLEHLAQAGAKDSTVRAYRAAMNKWFLPTLGSRSLDRVTPSDVEHVMGKMRAAGLSNKSMRNYLGVLRALFNHARDKRRRWARDNPVEDVDVPKAPVYVEIQYLTTDEVWQLVDAAAAGELQRLDRVLYLTAAMTGLRIGELQALDWRSIDFAHSRVRVRRSWDRKTKQFTLPKSKRSQRAVPLPDVVAGELDLLHQEQPGRTLDDLVFGHPLTGEPLGHRTLYNHLRHALEAAGLEPSFGFHALRHSYGTALAGQGVPMRTLQEWMGHKDITTTQRYADYCPNPREREVVEDAFKRQSLHQQLGTNPGTNLRESNGTESN